MDKIRADQPLPSDPNMHVMWRRGRHRQNGQTPPDSHRAGPTGKVREAAPPPFGTTLTRFVAPEGGETRVFHPPPRGRPGEVYMYCFPGGVA